MEREVDWTQSRSSDSARESEQIRALPGNSGGVIPELQHPRALRAFRELRTELLRRTNGRPFDLVVSSVVSGGGATHVASNLAISIARHRDRTAILIDCNTDNPSLHQRFGMERGPGLTEYLLNPGAASLSDIVRSTPLPRLQVVTQGERLTDDPECLAGREMRRLLADLKSGDEKTHVILDVASMETSADARILADLCGMVTLVVPYGRVMGSQVSDAARAFEGGQLAGVVFNRLPTIRGK